jgi:hypothetical protein
MEKEELGQELKKEAYEIAKHLTRNVGAQSNLAPIN